MPKIPSFFDYSYQFHNLFLQPVKNVYSMLYVQYCILTASIIYTIYTYTPKHLQQH